MIKGKYIKTIDYLTFIIIKHASSVKYSVYKYKKKGIPYTPTKGWHVYKQFSKLSSYRKTNLNTAED